MTQNGQNVQVKGQFGQNKGKVFLRKKQQSGQKPQKGSWNWQPGQDGQPGKWEWQPGQPGQPSQPGQPGQPGQPSNENQQPGQPQQNHGQEVHVESPLDSTFFNPS